MASPKMISLRKTKKYSSHVDDEVQQIREDRDFTDFNITINEEVLPCHRMTLAINSPVLKAVLKSEITEASSQSVSLDHIPLETMRVILDFMYLSAVTFQDDQLMDLLVASDFLQMEVLKDMCIDEVPAVLNSENVVSWFKLANKLALSDIKCKCAEIMMSCLTKFSNNPDFLLLSATEVQDFFSDALRSNVNHDGILYATMNWVNHDQDDRLSYLEDLLHQVQFDNCSQRAIVDVMDTYGTIVMSNMKMYKMFTKAMKQLTEVPKRMLVIIGGQIHKDVRRVCWQLNRSKKFTELCQIPFEIAKHHSVCRCPQGFVITGGVNSDLCIMFTAATKSWAKLQNMPAKRWRHGSIYIKDVLYVFGGGSDGRGSVSVAYLTIKDGRWQRGPDLPIVMRWPKVAEVDGSMYLLDAWFTKKLLELDVEKQEWNSRAPIPVGELDNKVSIVAVNGQLNVAGGLKKISAWYTPATDSWCIAQGPAQWHYFGSLVHYNDAVLLLGGRDVPDQQGSDDIEVFNCEHETWSTSIIKMPASLKQHHAMVLDFPPED